MGKTNYKFFLIIFVISILAIFIFSSENKQIANIDSHGENIICFGDSLTSGYNVAVDENYPRVLSRLLKSPVINAGKDGDTTKTALSRVENDVLEKDPLLVIVILGANDFLGDIPKEETFSNLRVIIRSIKSKGAIVALGQLGPFGMYDYRDDFKNLAKQEKILLIKDIMAGIFAHPELMNDYVHPNAKGYEKLAQKIYKAILPILEKNRKLRVQIKTQLTEYKL